MKNSRAYKEYQKIIPHLHECSDETLREVVEEMRQLCQAILNLPELAKQHNKKIEMYFNEDFLKIGDNVNFKPVNELDRVEMLTELCFEVNKVTKYINVNDFGRLIIERVEREESRRKGVNITGIKDILNKKYYDIYRDLQSKVKKHKRKGIESYLKLEKEEENIFEIFYEYTNNMEYWYKIKDGLLAQIIKELANNPEKYKNYNYGFIIDKIEEAGEIREIPVFGIDIPGHEGTYEFHVLHKENTIYEDDSIQKVKHPFSKLVNGDRKINKKQWYLTINDIKDINDREKLETDLENLKRIAKRYTTENEILEDKDNVFRKIHYISLLLEKDLKEQLSEISKTAVKTYVSEQKSFIEDENKKYKNTINDSKKFNNIINNVIRYKKIFYSSNTMDTKVAIEVIRNKAIKVLINNEIRKRKSEAIKQGIDPKTLKPLSKEEIEKIKKSIEVIQIEPGQAPESINENINQEKKGLYINTSKDGYYEKPIAEMTGRTIVITDKDGKTITKNPNKNKIVASEMIKINVDENLRETSVCGLLDRYGFDVPKDVVKYANDVSSITSAITDDSRNAYLLADTLDGERIIELCKELEEKGETLISASLTDEQLKKYKLEDVQKFYEEDIKKDKKDLEYVYLIEDKDRRIQIVKEKKDKEGNIIYIPECKIEEQKVKTKIAINRNENPGQLAFYVAYAQGADYCISINEDKEKGVQLAVQSNPCKCDLPWNIRRWAYKKLKDRIEDPSSTIKDVQDILNEKTRIVIGGRNRKDIFLNDKRKNKESSYMEFTINQLINLIKNDEQKKISNIDFENILSKLIQIIDKEKDIGRAI